MALDFLQMLQMIPQILGMLQIVVYIFLAWFLGSLAMKGMKKRFGLAVRILLSFGLGFLCLIGGTVIPSFFGLFQDGFMRMLQIDLFVGGIIMSVVFGVSLYMITRKSGKGSLKKINEKLRERIKILEGSLFKSKVKPIQKSVAMEKAEEENEGYKAKKAMLEKTDWVVYLESGKKQAITTIGGYDGEVRDTRYRMPLLNHLISEPVRLAGIIIIIAFVVFSVANFRGFPSMSEGFGEMISSATGLPEDQIDMLMGGGSSGGDVPEGCVSASAMFTRYGMNIANLPAYSNEQVRSMLEEETGQDVLMMYRADYEGSEYILGVTVPPDMDLTQVTQEEIISRANFCVATETRVCDCMKGE